MVALDSTMNISALFLMKSAQAARKGLCRVKGCYRSFLAAIFPGAYKQLLFIIFL
jgi:hypothetical protein